MPLSLSHFIDMARWIAALAVLVGHAGVLITISDIMVGPHGPGVYAWWFLAAFWHQAVVVFFVISGFLVGGAVLQRLRRPAPFLRDYLIDRFSRIYIVLAPVLAFGFVLDLIGRRLFAGSGIYEWPGLELVYNPIHMFTALLQLQAIWASQVGTNGPLWSLACEFWYYVTFPLLLLPLSRAYSTGARLLACGCGFALIVILSIPDSFFSFGYGIWALGALVAVARRPLVSSKWLSLVVFLVTATVIRLAVRGSFVEAHPLIHKLADVATAVTFANLLLTLRFSADAGFSFCRWPLHRRLSDFSYSLYASHAPIVFLFWAGAGSVLGKDWHKLLPTPLHWGLAFALIATSLAVGYGFSTLTEARTGVLRKFLRALFERIDRLPSSLEMPAAKLAKDRGEGR
jgi:peptidoglycan/LPS O-acetylase OafA/YrhL